MEYIKTIDHAVYTYLSNRGYEPTHLIINSKDRDSLTHEVCTANIIFNSSNLFKVKNIILSNGVKLNVIINDDLEDGKFQILG